MLEFTPVGNGISAIEAFYKDQVPRVQDELGARMFAINQALHPVNLAGIQNWGETTPSEIAKFVVGQSPVAASHWREDRHSLRVLERNRDNIGSRRVEQVLVQIGIELRKIKKEDLKEEKNNAFAGGILNPWIFCFFFPGLSLK